MQALGVYNSVEKTSFAYFFMKNLLCQLLEGSQLRLQLLKLLSIDSKTVRRPEILSVVIQLSQLLRWVLVSWAEHVQHIVPIRIRLLEGGRISPLSPTTPQIGSNLHYAIFHPVQQRPWMGSSNDF